MALTFTLNQQGATFKVKVTDCTTDTAITAANITDQKIIFRKPNGTIIEKTAVLVVDTQNPSESFVEYQEPTGTSILDDITSNWEYKAEITLIPGNTVRTSQSKIFTVVK